MAKSGLVGHEARVWFANFAAHLIVAAAAYIWLSRRASAAVDASPAVDLEAPEAFTRMQLVTLALIAAWIAGVVGFGLNLGLSAFAVSALLLLANAGDERKAVHAVPWGIIMMVSGVSVLIAVLEKTGGMDLFTSFLARTASPATVNGVIAFVTGAISTYSSTSGVVLPAFLPTVSTLVGRLGGGDPLAVALSINVGSSLVDVSPLSTIGALCVAAVHDPTESRALFRSLMIWGLSMTIIGAILCQALAGLLARA
jgi:di/tricarboxylate transporter